MGIKYFSLDRVAELWQRGRARLGLGLDKLIRGLYTVAFRASPLPSLRRDDGNWIRRTSSFIFLNGRGRVSLSGTSSVPPICLRFLLLVETISRRQRLIGI